MKIFIGGSKAVKINTTVIEDMLEKAIQDEVEFVIGDCYGVDATVQSFLAEMEYSHVTVFTALPKARHNVGRWREIKIDATTKKSFFAHRKKDAAMVESADAGFMIWDGKSKGTFLNIIDLLAYGKTVKVYFTETQNFVTLHTAKQLSDIFPNGAEAESYLSTEEQAALLKCFIPSVSMREYLAEKKLNKHNLSAIIRGSAVSLEKKLQWLRLLAGRENVFAEIANKLQDKNATENKIFAVRSALFTIKNSFAEDAGQIRRALQELTLKPGEIFNLVEAWYDDELRDRKTDSGMPVLSLEKALDYIYYDIKECEIEKSCTCWYELQKWVPNADGTMSHTYTYYLWQNQIIYFEKTEAVNFDEEKSESISYLFEPKTYRYSSDSQNLNLPIPFHVGDIVTIDCRPFHPVHHAVILEVGNNIDCCCVQALCSTETGTWLLGALKHGNIFLNDFFVVSPLYRLAECTEPLPEQEKLLYQLREYLAGDEECGRSISNKLTALKEINKAREINITEQTGSLLLEFFGEFDEDNKYEDNEENEDMEKTRE